MSSFILKGRTAPLTMLRITSADITHVQNELEAKVRAAPHFFAHSLFMIDLDELDTDLREQVDVESLITFLRGLGVVPALLKGGNEEQNTIASAMHVGIFTESAPKAKDEPEQVPEQDKKVPVEPTCLVLRQPVRSGQKVYARGKDLVVFGPVNSGAEVIADGNIHIYGALRGRALAGGQDKLGAHIFCRQLDAEMLSIAGYYRTSEQFTDELRGRAVHCRLVEEKLVVEPVD